MDAIVEELGEDDGAAAEETGKQDTKSQDKGAIRTHRFGRSQGGLDETEAFALPLGLDGFRKLGFELLGLDLLVLEVGVLVIAGQKGVLALDLWNGGYASFQFSLAGFQLLLLAGERDDLLGDGLELSRKGDVGRVVGFLLVRRLAPGTGQVVFELTPLAQETLHLRMVFGHALSGFDDLGIESVDLAANVRG